MILAIRPYLKGAIPGIVLWAGLCETEKRKRQPLRDGSHGEEAARRGR